MEPLDNVRSSIEEVLYKPKTATADLVSLISIATIKKILNPYHGF
uniref:Uncharacterized protein n=1 Tax=Lepeophtheirus salmonis TaxID=72036 RepID=A0A0K2U779_LEPSM